MSKSNAQRQQEYRDRHLKGMTEDIQMLERLNTLVDANTKTQLKRLVHCYGVTQRTMLERLVDEATHTLLKSLDGQQQNDFYDMKLTLRRNEDYAEVSRRQTPH